MKKDRNWLERKLDEYNHTMELIRTILPIIILVLQVYILVKVLWNIGHLHSLKNIQQEDRTGGHSGLKV